MDGAAMALALLFNGDAAASHPTVLFEVPALAGNRFQTANGSRFLDVPNPDGSAGTAISLRTHESDHNSNTADWKTRTQGESPYFIDSGEYVTQVFMGYLPSTLPSPPQFFTMASMYGPPFGGTGPRTMQLQSKPDSTHHSIGIQDQTSTLFWQATVAVNTWWKIAIRTFFATPGWVEIYFAATLGASFALQTLIPSGTRRSYNTRAPGVNDGGANNIRVNNYHRYPWSGVSGFTEWFMRYHRGYDGASALTTTQYAAELNALTEYQATGGGVGAPAAPHIDLVAGAGKVTVNRGAITGARAGDTWQLYRDTSAAFTAPVNVNLAIPLATTSYDDTTVTNGVTYYYRASVGNATDGYGAWDASNTPSATPIASGGGTWVQVGTGSTYVVAAADVGHTIRFGVVATNASGSSVETFSAPTAAVTAVTTAPANSSAPTVSGTTQSGQTLSGSVGVWTQSPTGYAWKWQRETSAGSGTFTDIAGATGTGTSPSFVLTGSEVGLKVRLSVTATNSVGSTTAVSAASAAVTSAAPSLVLARYALALDGTTQKVVLSSGGGFTSEPLAWGALVYLTGTTARTYAILGFPLPDGNTPARDLTVGVAATTNTGGWHDQTFGQVGATGFPANKWVWLVATRNNDAGGTIRVEFCDMATGVWSALYTSDTAFSFAAASGSSIIIGGLTGSSSSTCWQGRFLAAFKAHAFYTDAQMKALVSSQSGQFYIDPAVLLAAPSVENVWSTANAPASAIQDLKGTAHEQSRVGTSVFDAGSAILPLKVS